MSSPTIKRCEHPRCTLTVCGSGPTWACNEHKMWAEGAAYGRCQAGADIARLHSEVFEANRMREAAEKYAQRQSEDGKQLRAEAERLHMVISEAGHLLLTDEQAEDIRRREMTAGVDGTERVMLAYHDRLARLRAEVERRSGIWDLEEKALADVAMWPEWKRKAAGLRSCRYGPDSEAARAYRGEGTLRADWARLEALARDVEAATADAVAPDPDYTPAVRRVAAWTDTHRRFHPTKNRWMAYLSAAMRRIIGTSPSATRLRSRLSRMDEEEGGVYHDRVRDRLARLLRHWDEKAGHR